MILDYRPIRETDKKREIVHLIDELHNSLDLLIGTGEGGGEGDVREGVVRPVPPHFQPANQTWVRSRETNTKKLCLMFHHDLIGSYRSCRFINKGEGKFGRELGGRWNTGIKMEQKILAERQCPDPDPRIRKNSSGSDQK